MGSISHDQSIFGLAIFMGGAAQVLAGIMEFRVGNTFGTTCHCCYGTFWLAYAMFLVPSLAIKQSYQDNEHAYGFALGIFLLAWCLLTIIFFVAALRTNLTILIVFGFLGLTYFFLSVAHFLSAEHVVAAVRVNRAGGVCAVICALAAFYAGSSGLMTEDTTWVRFPLGEFSYTPKGHVRMDSVDGKSPSAEGNFV